MIQLFILRHLISFIRFPGHLKPVRCEIGQLLSGEDEGMFLTHHMRGGIWWTGLQELEEKRVKGREGKIWEG